MKLRFSTRKKIDAVIRLLLGKHMDCCVARAGLPRRDSQSGVKGRFFGREREPDVRDEEMTKLKAMIKDLTMHLELSREAGECLALRN